MGAGEVDCTLVSNYRINRVKDLCDENGLATLTTGKTMEMGFATRREDDCLYSILNKVTRCVPATVINSALTNYGFRDEKASLAEVLKDNLPTVIATVAVIVAVILALVIKNMRAEAKVAEGNQIISEAERDPLTNLYNWNFFLVYANRISREQPNKHMDAVVMNIDRFHSVNALHGREFGDNVLRELGREIQRFLDETEGIASRFESDRFDIYGVKPWQEGVDPSRSLTTARTACKKMLRQLRQPGCRIRRSHGRKGRARPAAAQRLWAVRSENREIEVFYQPKYNVQVAEPTLSSAEALVRWRHPKLGLISPGEFIPLLESSGQISQRGQIRVGGGGSSGCRLARRVRQDLAGVGEPLAHGRV